MSDRLPYKVGECEPRSGSAVLGTFPGAGRARCGKRGLGGRSAALAAAAGGGRRVLPAAEPGPSPPCAGGAAVGEGGAAPLASRSRLCRSPGPVAPSLPRRSEPLAGTGLAPKVKAFPILEPLTHVP